MTTDNSQSQDNGHLESPQTAPMKDLQEVIAEIMYVHADLSDLEHETEINVAIEELLALFHQELEREREDVWNKIYAHFEAIPPDTMMPYPNSPRESVLAELNKLKAGP